MQAWGMGMDGSTLPRAAVAETFQAGHRGVPARHTPSSPDARKWRSCAFAQIVLRKPTL